MALLAEKVPLLADVVSGGPLPDPWHEIFNGCVLCADTTVWGLKLKSGDHVPMCSGCQKHFLQPVVVCYHVVDATGGMVDYLIAADPKLRARFILYRSRTLARAAAAAYRLVAAGRANLVVVRIESKPDRPRNVYPEFTFRDGRVLRASSVG